MYYLFSLCCFSRLIIQSGLTALHIIHPCYVHLEELREHVLTKLVSQRGECAYALPFFRRHRGAVVFGRRGKKTGGVVFPVMVVSIDF